MARDKAQPLVKPAGVGAGSVGGQLDEAAACLARHFDRVAHQAFADPTAAPGAGDTHALDLAPLHARMIVNCRQPTIAPPASATSRKLPGSAAMSSNASK